MVGWLARLLNPGAAPGKARTRTAGPDRRTRAGPPASAAKTDRAQHPGGKGVYSVQRRVIVSLRHGWKRTTTRKVTKEWRHGNCPVRHQTRRAALRCRNP